MRGCPLEVWRGDARAAVGVDAVEQCRDASEAREGHPAKEDRLAGPHHLGEGVGVGEGEGEGEGDV